MIVLHSARLVFLKPRKVGGTSFEIALSQFADAKSVITPIGKLDEEIRQSLGFRGPQNYRFALRETRSVTQLIRAVRAGGMPMKFWNHIEADVARDRLGLEIWDNYRKVSIVRSPFDRMVSSYFWNVEESARENLTFECFCLTRQDLIMQNRKIYELEGRNCVDFMLRYDRLSGDVADLESRTTGLEGLSRTFSEIHAKSGTRPKNASVSEMFSQAPRSLALISELCSDEIVRFGFETP